MGMEPEKLSVRIEQIEASISFSERTTDQLNEVVNSLNAEVLALTRRLALLEGKMGDLADAVEQSPPVQAPPHSAGPDVSRDPI